MLPLHFCTLSQNLNFLLLITRIILIIWCNWNRCVNRISIRSGQDAYHDTTVQCIPYWMHIAYHCTPLQCALVHMCILLQCTVVYCSVVWVQCIYNQCNASRACILHCCCRRCKNENDFIFYRIRNFCKIISTQKGLNIIRHKKSQPVVESLKQIEHFATMWKVAGGLQTEYVKGKWFDNKADTA